MDPQPCSQGNYELNEKCDNHDDWWCLFYWSLFFCSGHGQSPWRGPSVWWLQCTHIMTHSSPKRSQTVDFLKQRRGNNKKTLNLGMESLKQMLFCLHFVQWTIVTSYLVYTETKAGRFSTSLSFVINHSIYSPLLMFFVSPEFENKLPTKLSKADTLIWWARFLFQHIFPCYWPLPSECLLMPHCPLVVHSMVTGAPLLLIPISTCGVIETRVSSCQGLGHHVIEFCLVSQSATKHSTG